MLKFGYFCITYGWSYWAEKNCRIISVLMQSSFCRCHVLKDELKAKEMDAFYKES